MKHYNIILLQTKKYLLLFTSVLFLFTCCKKRNSDENEKLISYLKTNNSVIDTSIVYNEQEFEIMSNYTNDYNIFLFGETHAVKFNELIDLKLLKYLYFNNNVRYYLVELGFSNVTYLNDYIRTGNIDVLDYFYEMNYGTMYTNQDSYNTWKKICEFNETLPENEKITVIGIDVEHNIDFAFEYLNEILPESNPPGAIDDKITLLKNYSSLNHEQKHLLGVDLYNDIQIHESEYQNYLNDDFYNFRFVVANIEKTWRYKYQEQSEEFRDETMYTNFVQLSEHYPKAGYYGRFGKEHVIRYYAKTTYVEINENRFALYLNSDTSEFKNKVVSIAGIYFNSQYLSNNNGYHEENVSENFKNSDYIDFENSLIQIFKLDNENSPFNENLYLINEGLSNSTTRYFQYVIKIKNSPACTEYQQ